MIACKGIRAVSKDVFQFDLALNFYENISKYFNNTKICALFNSLTASLPLLIL
jgi:hypothetical protein